MKKILMNIEDFINKIKNNELEKITFVYDLTCERYKAISKENLITTEYSKLAIFQKITSLYKAMTDSEIVLTSDQVRSIKNAIPNVDGFIHDLSKEPGVVEIGGMYYYNHWVYSENKLRTLRNTEDSSKITFEEMNTEKYKHLNFVLDNLLNIEENIATDKRGNTVNVKKNFIHWLAHCMQYNKKTGNAWAFVSEQPGAGKGLLCEIIRDFFSMDYYTAIDGTTLSGDFNSILKNKLFSVLNEVKIEKKDHDLVSNKLKTWITEEDFILREMRKDQNMTKSVFNLMIFTNQKHFAKIEPNDRRYNVINTHKDSLDYNVMKKFKITTEELYDFLQIEKYFFYEDMLRLDVDTLIATHNPLMTEAKKDIIAATNTKSQNIRKLIEERKISDLKDYFIDCDKEELLEVFLKQVSLGFLTNDIVNDFLHINIRDFANKDTKLGGKLSKKVFWDNQLGSKAILVGYKKSNGEKTSAKVRTFKGFNSKDLESFFNHKECNEMNYDSFDYVSKAKELDDKVIIEETNKPEVKEKEEFEYEDDIAFEQELDAIENKYKKNKNKNK